MLAEYGETDILREQAEIIYAQRMGEKVKIALDTSGTRIPNDTLPINFLFTAIHEDVKPEESILNKKEADRNRDAAKMYGEQMVGRIMNLPEGGRFGLPHAEVESLSVNDKEWYDNKVQFITGQMLYRAQLYGYPVKNPDNDK